MQNAEPRQIIMNILDRAAFTAGPFWEATPDERAQVADLIGMPAVEATIEFEPDSAPRVTTAASPFLALAILNEIAIELVIIENPSIRRSDVIARIRARAAELLADEGDE